jgi:uncharacterized membrane protein (DUF373 family)
MSEVSSPEKGAAPPGQERLRRGILQAFTRFEGVVYVCLGLILAYTAGALIVTGAIALWHNLMAGAPSEGLVELLDRALLVLVIVELLYTVKVSFESHTLVPEPFLVVSLIAVTRRIVVVIAEVAHRSESHEAFRKGALELGLLSLMVVALVVSLRVLRARPGVEKEKAAR